LYIEISAAEQGEINKPLVLCGHRSSPPVAKIGCIMKCCICQRRVVCEKAAVEFCRVVTEGITTEHITEELVVAAGLPLGGVVGRIGVDIDKASLPEGLPPGFCGCRGRGFLIPDVCDCLLQAVFPILLFWCLGCCQDQEDVVGRAGVSAHEAPTGEIGIQVVAAGDAGRNHVCAKHAAAEGEIFEGVEELWLYRIKALLVDGDIENSHSGIVAMKEDDLVVLKTDAVAAGDDFAAGGLFSRPFVGIGVVGFSGCLVVFYAPAFVNGFGFYRLIAGQIDVYGWSEDVDPDVGFCFMGAGDGDGAVPEC